MTRSPLIPFTAAAALAAVAAPASAQLVYENGSGGNVRLYGQFNPSYLRFDDGVDTTGKIADNTNSNSRVGLALTQPFGANTFRFNFETALGLRPSAGLSQTATPDVLDWRRTNIRLVDFSLETENYGTFYLGQGETATAETGEIDLSGTGLTTYAEVAAAAESFQFRTAAGALSGIALEDAFAGFGSSRRGRVRYDTPEFGGFFVSVSYGEEILASANDDTYLDAAINYDNEVGDFEIEASLGFARRERNGVDRDDTLGSVSLLHESGVSVTFAAGNRKDGGDYGYGKLGYKANWFPVGATALSVDYYLGNDFTSPGSESTSVGFGAVQSFDDANVEAYLGYRTYELTETAASYRDASSIQIGARWKF